MSHVDDRDVPRDKEFTLEGKTDWHSYNFTWIKGMRWTMEDSHLAIKINEKTWIFAIFDGHGGKSVSQALPDMIIRVYKSVLRDQFGGILSSENAVDLMQTVFQQTDEKILQHLHRAGENVGKVGATAALVLINEDIIISAHCGDSRIHVYNTNNKIEYVTLDHKPSGADERKRITDAGGTVFFGRVMGDLAVARAFGDYQYKKMTYVKGNALGEKETVETGKMDLVVVKPEVRVIDRKQVNVSGVMICCDGVTDVMSDERIKEIYLESEGSSQKLVQESFARHSQDNISACFVKLNFVKRLKVDKIVV